MIGMENFFNKLSSNSNNLLNWIVDDLKQLIGYTKDNVLEENQCIKEITLEVEVKGIEKVENS